MLSDCNSHFLLANWKLYIISTNTGVSAHIVWPLAGFLLISFQFNQKSCWLFKRFAMCSSHIIQNKKRSLCLVFCWTGRLSSTEVLHCYCFWNISLQSVSFVPCFFSICEAAAGYCFLHHQSAFKDIGLETSRRILLICRHRNMNISMLVLNVGQVRC